MEQGGSHLGISKVSPSVWSLRGLFFGFRPSEGPQLQGTHGGRGRERGRVTQSLRNAWKGSFLYWALGTEITSPCFGAAPAKYRRCRKRQTTKSRSWHFCLSLQPTPFPVLASPLPELAVPHPGLSAQVGAGWGIPEAAPLPEVGWVLCVRGCADQPPEPGQWSLKPTRAFLFNVT